MQLSELATDRLNKTAPALSKYIKAFSDMSDEVSDDRGVQVGVFILKNGASEFYIPVIAKGGTVYPIDSIFMADQKCFFPLTKKVIEMVTTAANKDIGKPATTPRTAVKNPDLKDLIVPPKTGKFVYASNGRLGEFAAMLPDHLKDKLIGFLEDQEVNMNTRDLVELREILNVLKTRQKIEEKVTAEFPQVITDGEGLSDAAIQDILNKGYHVANPPANVRVAVESGGANQFTTVSGIDEGKAFGAVTTEGTVVPLAVLKTVPADGSRPGGKMSSTDCPKLLLGEGGVLYRHSEYDKLVVKAQEYNYTDILNSVKSYPLDALVGFSMDSDAGSRGYFEDFMVQTPMGFMGPFKFRNVVQQNGWINFNEVSAHPSVAPSGAKVEGKWLINSGCTFFPVRSDHRCKFERNLNAAHRRHEMQMTASLPESFVLSHSDGAYAMDNQFVGDKPKVIAELVVTKGISVPDAEAFVKSAEEKRSTRVFMTKQAATNRTPIPEYGEKPATPESGTGTKEDRLRGSNAVKNIKDAAQTQDRQVVEATIMSELLQDQDMMETAAEYLDDIKAAVDKLGRVLVLSRLHSAKLAEDYDSEGISNLTTSIRNSFRSLGDNYLQLEQMSQNV